MDRPFGRHAAPIATALLALVVVACAVGNSSSAPSIPSASSASASPSAAVVIPSTLATPTPEPTATDQPTLEKGDLRRVTFDPTTLTIVCPPEPDLLQRDPPRPAIVCGTSGEDALVLGLAAIQTVAKGTIDRLYLQWPTCPATGCTHEDVQTATVVGWAGGDAYSTVIDVRHSTVPVPMPESSIEWPTFGSSEPPMVARPTIKNAPTEVAERTPYPFCGRAELGDPPSVIACFRDAVLAGRPAEMIQRVYGTEGGVLLQVFRFSGRGAIVRYLRGEGHWSRQFGTLSLSSDATGWSMSPWDMSQKFFR